MNVLKKYNISLMLMLSILLLASSLFVFSVGTAEAGTWRSGYQVAFTHYDPWYEPHYGAYFNGSSGVSGTPYFVGSSGSYSGYAYNNWWGSNHNVMLLSKSWLFALSCNFSRCEDRWEGNNHIAYLVH